VNRFASLRLGFTGEAKASARYQKLVIGSRSYKTKHGFSGKYIMRAKALSAAMMVVLSLGLAVSGYSQAAFKTLYSFDSDVGEPQAGLVLSGTTLYGTTTIANGISTGTIFSINTDGTGFAVLHTFGPFTTLTDGNGTITNILNADGFDPGSMVISGNTLFGTALEGGLYGYGTVFEIETNGSNFSVLHSFTESDGGPRCLILSGDTLYGAENGESNLFSINTNGSGFTNLFVSPDLVQCRRKDFTNMASPCHP
jgi:uncharacterized repeat protein (TIGR03803 family)